MPAEGTPLPLVLDWDGTVTEVDTLHMVNDRFGDPEVFGIREDPDSKNVIDVRTSSGDITVTTNPAS